MYDKNAKFKGEELKVVALFSIPLDINIPTNARYSPSDSNKITFLFQII